MAWPIYRRSSLRVYRQRGLSLSPVAVRIVVAAECACFFGALAGPVPNPDDAVVAAVGAGFAEDGAVRQRFQAGPERISKGGCRRPGGGFRRGDCGCNRGGDAQRGCRETVMHDWQGGLFGDDELSFRID